MMKRGPLLAFCLACVLAPWSARASGAEVDQVLVLYNKNWTRDAPGTAPGQDSEEVARYYVARHTDPKTGKKPHLLGLDIRHFGPKTSRTSIVPDRLEEASKDNHWGYDYTGPHPFDMSRRTAQRCYLLSSHIECRLDPAKVDWDSLVLKLGRSDDPAAASTVFARGASVAQPALEESARPGGGRVFRTSADRLGLHGPVHLWVHIQDKAGRTLQQEHVVYADYQNIQVPVDDRQLDWRTLTIDLFQPASPSKRLRLHDPARPRALPALKLLPGREGGGTITFNAASVGLGGDLVLAWSGRTKDGRPVRERQVRLRDSRVISLALADPEGKIDWRALTVRFSAQAEPASARVLYENGACPIRYQLVNVVDGAKLARPRRGIRVLQLNAWRAGWRGEVYAWLTVRTPPSKVPTTHKARFHDPLQFRPSRTGPDGIRDDQNYLDEIEKPVKAFLEDPARAVGTRPLKDHILYIVLAHGMPLVADRTYGVRQVANPVDLTGGGPLVALGQRLEMMYYDLEAVLPPKLYPGYLPKTWGPFQYWVPLSTWRRPFIGGRLQPYMHPKAYGRIFSSTVLPGDFPHFDPARRRMFPKRFLYLASRVDARDPLDAMAQVDSAVYASRYLTPKIGQRPQGVWAGQEAMAGAAKIHGVKLLKHLGFPGVYSDGAIAGRFGRKASGVYYPGSVDWYVKSENGCQSPRSPVRKSLAEGVTVTGGAARAFGGCAHTTTHAWWDASVFYAFLFGGYDLGEAWLASRIKLQWVTSFFGDPLYKPDLRRTRYDTTAPQVAGAGSIRVRTRTRPGGIEARIQVALRTTPENPEMAELAVKYWKAGRPAEAKEAVAPKYRARPGVTITGLAPDTVYGYRVVLTDPYLNQYDSGQSLGELTFRTPAGR